MQSQRSEDVKYFGLVDRVCVVAFLRQHLRLGHGRFALINKGNPLRRNSIFRILGLDSSTRIYQCGM